MSQIIFHNTFQFSRNNHTKQTMGRGGGRGSKRKMWNNGPSKGGGKGGGKENNTNNKKQDDRRIEWDTSTQLQNPNFETYYAYLGLHSARQESKTCGTTTPKFITCTTDEEKEEERTKFMTTMTNRLPASFRIGQHVDHGLKQQIIREVEQFAGTEMEILVDAEGNIVSKRDGEKRKADGDDAGDAGNAGNAGNDATTTTTENDTNKNTVEKTKTFTKKIAPAKSIPYIPYGYQLSVDRRTIKRNPPLSKFHEWLKVQQEAGFITRQETVSMIPPVVLGVESHHAVFDSCAAPGSKTCQMLEVIANIPEGKAEPEGYVVANDSDAKRAYMLVHQLRRLNSPALFISACDGQFFPMVRGTKDVRLTDEQRAQEGVFDRVLCDVPCTGDGTARKNPGIWKRWLATNGHALHPVQLNIAMNGARLTKVGGYMCYSTCSLNPIENEAVVAAVLRATDGSLELVDRRSVMNGFVARPGWSTWKVVSEAQTRKERRNQNKKNNEKMRKRREEWEKKNKENDGGDDNDAHKQETTAKEKDDEKMEIVEKKQTTEEEATTKPQWESKPPSWDEETLRKRLEERGMMIFENIDDVGHHKHIKRTMFPPTEEEVKNFHLEKCMRCLPHDMDTGGFFIALFKKNKPLGERARRMAKELEESPVEQKEAMVEDGEGNKDKTNEVTKKKKLNDGNVEEIIAAKKSSVEIIEEPKQSNGDGEGKSENADVNKKKKPERNYEKVSKEAFVDVDKTILDEMIEFYGMSDSFARNQLMARGTGQSKLLYFISSSVKKNVFDRGVHKRVRAIHSGLRAFERRSRGSEEDRG